MHAVETVYIVGAGGIGCAVGYVLRLAGVRVVFVDADAEKVKWGRTHGVRVDGRAPLQAEFCCFDDWMPSSSATVLLCTKCYDNSQVLERLPADVQLIPVQNGFDPALESRGTSWEGIASFVSECVPHRTHTRITRNGRLHLGGRNHTGSDKQRLPWAGLLAESLQRARLFRTIFVTDILPYKHTKLMYNAAISPVAAAAGLDNGQLLSVAPARRLFFSLLQENYAILRAAGVSLAKIGPFHPQTVDRILRHRSVARAFAWAFYPSLKGTYCSMSRDLPGGQTEIDYYNRYLIDLAGDRPCPLNRRVYQMVKHMERQQSVPSLHMLDEL
jgi:2-dehydropantoate 2-reductase